MKATSLIRLYPRAWRERYGEEFHDLVASHEARPRLIFDILIGALDARLAPQPQVAGQAKGAVAGGSVMEVLKAGCGRSPAMSRVEALKYALLIVGATAVTAVIVVWLKRAFGGNVWTEALGLATFSITPLVYTLMLMREHALRTRVVLGAALFAFLYTICLVSAWI